MSDTQLKRKRSQRDKAPATALPKRQKSDHLHADTATSTPKPVKIQTPKTTPKTQVKDQISTPTVTLPQVAGDSNNNALQVATTPGQAKKSSRRSRRKAVDRVAIDDAQVVEKPQAKVEGRSPWSLSKPLGGRFVLHDPIFAQDESCVFASNGREVEVLSIATSLVERKLPGPDHSATAFAVSVADEEDLYIASSTGRVQRWNWITGTPVNDDIKFEGSISALAVVASGDASQDALYAICQKSGDWNIVTGDRTIYTSKDALSHLRIEGDFVVAATSTKLVVGKRIASADSPRYDFVEITVSAGVTSLECRIESSESKKKAKTENVTVAVGNVSGEIFLYENVYPSDKSAESLTPRTLHWHREAVATLKWSKDGTYLISGGRETVLVLWQLTTGKKQFLPHLTAEIERLTVSPNGASYALQLADNSVMVLSTTELKPTANFAGLQAQSCIDKNTNAATAEEKSFLRPAAATLNPLSPDQLLLSVPSSTNETSQHTSSAAPRPFLQTYDISNDRHISRQALTRNMVTDYNKGPEGNRIKVPDVTHMQVSHDGQWLATAEHWSPPYPDVEHLASDKSSNDEQRLFRREVYLKIWRWDSERNLWALETRIDSPHQSNDDAQPGRILNLVSDPVEVGFASVGEDSCVRIWKPKTRLRNGIVVRGTKAEGLVDWSCRHSIPLDRSVELAEVPDQPRLLLPPKGAALAYSEDGSTIAVSQAFELATETPTVHFINTADGATEQARAGFFTGTVRALAFLDRHLIVLADQTIAVWDIVDESQLYCINLDRLARFGTSLLTTNPEDKTFAVSVKSKGGVSRVQIFSTTSSAPQFNQSLPYPASAVLAVKGRRGYKVLTTAAEVFTLSPRAAAPSIAGIRTRRGKRSGGSTLPSIASSVIATPTTATSDAQADLDAEMSDEQAEVLLLENDEEADKPVVRPEQLAQVFDRENIALMPISEMFDAVVGLFARKPRAVPVVASVA
ncbi:WD40 repeat-like protein [Aureobasidium pullulans EXF-150]|uniref:WD40 repeat-like protein n=1 Tax=Aureobasidium pullulans EXF-150 TaxID=1043002 RepID=A0A074XX20_AURPU|nr:WD40 repeat-like protein [Aureobasidium pullulans EXF-150]KEQ79216.1 WD40 repeat-like protein [Aureobasidium pullulans EXF-150]